MFKDSVVTAAPRPLTPPHRGKTLAVSKGDTWSPGRGGRARADEVTGAAQTCDVLARTCDVMAQTCDVTAVLGCRVPREQSVHCPYRTRGYRDEVIPHTTNWFH